MRCPPSTNGPDSPLPQNRMASSHDIVMKLNPSYISASCTSDGWMSVRVHICAAASRHAIVVRSSNWSHDGRPYSAVPTASTLIGGLRRSATVSACDTMTAVPPSHGTSQSNRHSGDEIIRASK